MRSLDPDPASLSGSAPFRDYSLRKTMRTILTTKPSHTIGDTEAKTKE
jgi:hypothetical protein